MITIYTDGSSTGKVGDGGWGFLMMREEEYFEDSGSAEETTNNRMEMTAVIESLKYVSSLGLEKEQIEIYCDSEYVVKGINERIPNLMKKIKKGKVVPNVDLWNIAVPLVSYFPNLDLKWIKGHSDNKYNDRCDELAKKARYDLTEYKNGKQ